MLCLPDLAAIELSRRDPLVPGLDLMLDPEALTHALRKTAPEAGVESARITYVKYKPSTNCLVGYQLQARGELVLAHAKACAPHTRDKLDYWRRQPPVVGALGSGVHYLHDGAIAVSVWPNDAKSATLNLLVDTESRSQFLRRLLPQNDELWSGTLETLAYKPERRYVGCLHTSAGPQAVIKVYAKPGHEVANDAHRLSAGGGQLQLPILLGRSRGRRALAFRWALGRLLSQTLQEAQFDPQQMYAVGEALAELHAQDARRLPLRSEQEFNDELRVEADTLSMILPQLADRANRLASRISREMPSSQRQTATHGDFHARQVLLSSTGVALLDLDRARRAPPLTDLASLAASLRREAVRGVLSGERVGAATDAFLEGYCDSASHFNAAEFNLYLAAELFRLSTRFVRYWESEWPTRTAALFEQAEAILGGRRSPAAVAVRCRQTDEAMSVPVTDPFDAATDGSMPGLHAALQPAVAERQLTRRLPQSLTNGQCVLRAIRVLRHKPGRRCLLAYDVELCGNDGRPARSTLLGKVRARGLDQRTFTLMEALRQTGFDDDSADGVSVPAGLAAIPAFQMWLQPRVAGQTVTELLIGGDGTNWAVRVAEALFKLHCTSIPNHRRHTPEDEIKILRERLSELADRELSWNARLTNVIRDCELLAAMLPSCVYRGVHRDFHPDQVLVSGTRLYLLDLDLYCLGDPAVDVGNFLAHLTELALRVLRNPRGLAACEHAFLRRYLELAGSQPQRAIHIYRILSLARHVQISTQFADRRSLTPVLLDLCERELREAVAQSGENVCSPSGVEVDHVSIA